MFMNKIQALANEMKQFFHLKQLQMYIVYMSN